MVTDLQCIQRRFLAAENIYNMSLDALKAEIAVKRKNTTQDVPWPSKYMRRGELEKLKAEQERKDREEKERKEREQEQKEREAKEAKERIKVSIRLFPCVTEY